MKCYLTFCFLGFIAFDDNRNLIDYELFQRKNIAKKLIEIQKGNLTKEEEFLLKRISKEYNTVVIETNISPSKYENLKKSEKFEFKTPSKGGEFLRSNIIIILKEAGFIESEEEYNNILYEVSMEITRYKLKEASEARDMLLIQAINGIDELDETTGKLVERLREWHAIHFPELNKIKSHEKYVKLIADYGDRDSIIDSGFLESDISVERSIGAEIVDEDVKIVQDFASSIKSLQESKKSLVNYIDEKMCEIAPNLRELVGSSLGAKLIAHAGSIKKLSMLPASTIQIMGAETALFRHLKTGEKPPKHGLIFQHPEIRSAKWWIRGKIARALAAKISIAVRKDFFSGEYDNTIKKSFEIKVEKIKKENPFPPRTRKAQKEVKKGRKKGKKKKKKKKREKYGKKELKKYY